MKIAFRGEVSSAEITWNMLTMAGLLTWWYPEYGVRIYRRKKSAGEAGNFYGNYPVVPFRQGEAGMQGRELAFYDCGSLKGKDVGHRAGHFDYTVINMPQTDEAWERFLQTGIYCGENVFFLIVSCFGMAVPERSRIEREYRIEHSKIGIFPYNNEFTYAMTRGKMANFMHTGINRTEKNRLFGKETKQFMQQFLKNLKLI